MKDERKELLAVLIMLAIMVPLVIDAATRLAELSAMLGK